MFDLSSLNKEQKEAVQSTEGPVLVLAGAGTGKTKVLTSRIAYIVSQGLSSIDQILAVTFTNKAAKEMKERTISLLNSTGFYNVNTESFWIGTFHSLALRMIRPNYEKFNRTRNFSIIDADDQLRIIKKILKEQEIDDKEHTPKSISYYINQWKNQCISPDGAINNAPRFSYEEVAGKIYSSYEEVLKSLDAIDFGDILKYSIDILKYNKETLEYYQNKFKYILVDEYQDTNSSQYIWLKLLSKQHGNICCVGDDDQSIYGWRGADVGNILKFDKDFKNPTIIRLGQNYRSTKNIIRTANGLISNNSMRMQKDFWTDEEAGSPVVVKALSDPSEEADFVSNLIANKLKNGIKFNDIAILVRAAFQTRAFEEKMLSKGIPYNVIGGIRFYERKEVKDAVAYLRIVANIDDGIAFERIINLPKRGIGPTSISKFYEISRENNISLPMAAKYFCDSSKNNTGKSISKLEDFFKLCENWRKDLDILSPSELMKKILIESEYIDMLKKTKTIENEGKLEILEELISSLQDFSDIREFLDYINLVLDNTDKLSSDKVTISTIHAAKGLEYRTVFIPGFEENIMPHQKSVHEKGDIGIEEERRLCYVAITRAKKEAYITLCNRRNMYGTGGWQYVNPSRFLYDLPKGSVKIL